MEITVTINAPDLSTAITNLAEALHGFYTREEEKPATKLKSQRLHQSQRQRPQRPHL